MRTFAAISIITLGLTQPLAAQSQTDACSMLGTLTVGQWASYQVTGADMPGGMTEMRMAIVNSEEVEGAEHFWFEIQASTQMGDMVMQALIPGYPYEPEDVKEMVVKMGGQPAMRMPQQMIARMGNEEGGSPADDFVEDCIAAEMIGHERIDVPAGAMSTIHLRVPPPDGGEAWLSTDVGFGIVRFAGDGFEMSLSGYGTDATSAITETPQSMPGMP